MTYYQYNSPTSPAPSSRLKSFLLNNSEPSKQLIDFSKIKYGILNNRIYQCIDLRGTFFNAYYETNDSIDMKSPGLMLSSTGSSPIEKKLLSGDAAKSEEFNFGIGSTSPLSLSSQYLSPSVSGLFSFLYFFVVLATLSISVIQITQVTQLLSYSKGFENFTEIYIDDYLSDFFQFAISAFTCLRFGYFLRFERPIFEVSLLSSLLFCCYKVLFDETYSLFFDSSISLFVKIIFASSIIFPLLDLVHTACLSKTFDCPQNFNDFLVESNNMLLLILQNCFFVRFINSTFPFFEGSKVDLFFHYSYFSLDYVYFYALSFLNVYCNILQSYDFIVHSINLFQILNGLNKDFKIYCLVDEDFCSNFFDEKLKSIMVQKPKQEDGISSGNGVLKSVLKYFRFPVIDINPTTTKLYYSIDFFSVTTNDAFSIEDVLTSYLPLSSNPETFTQISTPHTNVFYKNKYFPLIVFYGFVGLIDLIFLILWSIASTFFS